MLPRKWVIRKDVDETTVLKERFGELTTSRTCQEQGKVESCERFGNVFSSKDAENSERSSLATGGDAKVVCGDG